MSTETRMTEYVTDNGAHVKLSPSIVRNYLVQGEGRISDQEAMMFLMLCKNQRLDPFLRDAYLIKYGNKPATMVVGKDTFLKRAEHNDAFRGLEAGVIVMTAVGLQERQGALVLEDEQLVGGWARVYKVNREVPYYASVSFDEYVGRKADGTVNSQWAGKPATMIRKVALVQALREAFPDSFAGMYDQAEMGAQAAVDLSETPVVVPEKDVSPKKPVEAPPVVGDDPDNPDVTSDEEPEIPPPEKTKQEMQGKLDRMRKDAEKEAEEIF